VAAVSLRSYYLLAALVLLSGYGLAIVDIELATSIRHHSLETVKVCPACLCPSAT